MVGPVAGPESSVESAHPALIPVLARELPGPLMPLLPLPQLLTGRVYSVRPGARLASHPADESQLEFIAVDRWHLPPPDGLLQVVQRFVDPLHGSSDGVVPLLQLFERSMRIGGECPKGSRRARPAPHPEPTRHPGPAHDSFRRQLGYGDCGLWQPRRRLAPGVVWPLKDALRPGQAF